MRYCVTISSRRSECSGDGRRQKLHGGQDVDERMSRRRNDQGCRSANARLSEKGGGRDFRERATGTLQPQRGVDKGSFIYENF
jgi:hypothetical protein